MHFEIMVTSRNLKLKRSFNVLEFFLTMNVVHISAFLNLRAKHPINVVQLCCKKYCTIRTFSNDERLCTM